MKILNFGSCNKDIVYSVDSIVKGGETVKAHEMNIFVGGKGLNQSVALARAGAQVFHAGRIGTDGDEIKSFLHSVGADVTYLSVSETLKTGHATIQVDKNGENAIFVFPGANFEITHEMADDVLSHFDKGDILLLQNEINNISYIAQRAYEKGMKIFFNPAPFNEAAREIPIEKLHYLIMNESENAAYTGENDFEAFSKRIKTDFPDLHVIVTLGKNGCVYIDSNGVKRQNAYKVKAVDTTAAGDTFVGFFISQTAKQSSPEEALKTASAAAALSVTKHGAAPSVPTEDEVEEFLKNQNNR